MLRSCALLVYAVDCILWQSQARHCSARSLCTPTRGGSGHFLPMNLKAYSVILLSFSLLGSVFSQLLTTTDGAGNTVVVQVTSNAFGQPLTQTLQTLPPAPAGTSTLSTTTTTLTTTLAPAATTTQQQGPVGEPSTTPETPGGPTPTPTFTGTILPQCMAQPDKRYRWRS